MPLDPRGEGMDADESGNIRDFPGFQPLALKPKFNHKDRREEDLPNPPQLSSLALNPKSFRGRPF